MQQTQKSPIDRHPTAGFCLQLLRGPGHCVVRLSGRIGLEYGEAFEASLMQLIDRVEGRVVLDLTGLRFINVIGLGVVVRFGKAVQDRGGRMKLHGADARVGRLIHTVKLHEIFPPLEPAHETSDPALAGELASCA